MRAIPKMMKNMEEIQTMYTEGLITDSELLTMLYNCVDEGRIDLINQYKNIITQNTQALEELNKFIRTE